MTTNQKQNYKQYHMYTTTCAVSLGILATSFIAVITVTKFTNIGLSINMFRLLLAIIFTTSIVAYCSSGQANYFLARTHSLSRRKPNPFAPGNAKYYDFLTRPHKKDK